MSLYYRRFGKRVVDAVAGTIGLIVSAPVLLLCAGVVWVDLGRPVLFVQRRPGQDGRMFRLYKLRTMRDSRRADGARQPDRDRLTRVGGILRSASLDELPELWNVVRGEMSLVGPRPLLPEYLDRYTSTQARRHEVKPGITGWAQVNGRNALDWETKFMMDVWYVDHMSLALDLRIAWRTMTEVLLRRGINRPGHATACEFMGTREQ